MRQFCAVHLFCLLSLSIVASPLLISTEADARTKRRKKKKTVKPAPAKPKTTKAKVSGNRVAILKFDTFKTSKDVMSYFYTALQQQLKAKPGNKIMPSNNVTISELILTAGCVSADKACLSNLGGLIQADQIVFGSVQHSDNVHLFTIKIFDFKKKDFVRVIEDQTVTGDLAKLKDDSLLKDPAAGTGDDDEMFQLLLAVSEWVDQYCNRHFYPRTQTLEFDGNGVTRMLVPDLISLSSL